MARAGTTLTANPTSLPTGTWACRAGYNEFSGRLSILGDRHLRTSDSNPQIRTCSFDRPTRQVTLSTGNWDKFRGEDEAPGNLVQRGRTDAPMLYLTGADEAGSHLAATTDVLKSCGWRSGELYDLS